jgi:hypothetical protein
MRGAGRLAEDGNSRFSARRDEADVCLHSHCRPYLSPSLLAGFYCSFLQMRSDGEKFHREAMFLTSAI